MVKVKMLETADGANDGINISTYFEGKVYEVSMALAEAFINGGRAEPYIEPTPAPESVPKQKQKSKKGAPMNKSLGGAPEDKAR